MNLLNKEYVYFILLTETNSKISNIRYLNEIIYNKRTNLNLENFRKLKGF